MAASEADGCYWSANVQTSTFVEEAVKQGVGSLTIFLENPNGKIPISHPKNLKDELISKTGQNIDISYLKVTRNGKIICVTENTETAIKMLQIQELMGVQITPRLILDTLTSKFLLYDMPLNVKCSEIAEELIMNGMPVIEVRRFQKNERGNKTPLKTILVSKIGQNLPDRIRLWFEEIRIRQFIDRPRQCNKCLQFSHSVKMCKNENTCSKCGGKHNIQSCQSEEIKCSNCGEEHEATSKLCKIYIREVEINKFKCQNHLTITEARRRYSQNNNQGKTPTYAGITASPPQVKNKEIQELSTRMDKMMEKFDTTLQTFLATQIETFNKVIEGMTTTFNNMIHHFSNQIMTGISSKASSEASSSSHKRDIKKIRKSQDKSVPSSPSPCGTDLGDMNFAVTNDLGITFPLSPGLSFLDSPGQRGPLPLG